MNSLTRIALLADARTTTRTYIHAYQEPRIWKPNLYTPIRSHERIDTYSIARWYVHHDAYIHHETHSYSWLLRIDGATGAAVAHTNV